MIPLPQKAQNIIDTLHDHGFQVYAVGGSVRDMIMGKSTSGWDYTTDATPEEIQNFGGPEGYLAAFAPRGRYVVLWQAR